MTIIRTYTIYKDDELLVKLGELEDVLDTIHTSLGEMSSGIYEALCLRIEVGAGNEDEL